jgi:Cu(I)/Ag(I) efflux system periplasmic protein CusF
MSFTIRVAALASLVALPLAVSLPAVAQTAAAAAEAPAAQTVSADMTDGEIRKVSKDLGKVTIKHGTIKNLDMPPMTMVFTAKDPAMLDTIAVGDKVKFTVVDEGGKMVVTAMQPAK